VYALETPTGGKRKRKRASKARERDGAKTAKPDIIDDPLVEETLGLSPARLFAALRRANPELTRGLDLEGAIQITQDRLEERASIKSKRALVSQLRLNAASAEQTIQLDVSQDALMMSLRVYKLDSDGNTIRKPNGRLETVRLRCLIDSGATISCIAKRCTDQHSREFTPFRDAESDGLDITFANDEQADSSASYSHIPFTEARTGAAMKIDKMYELNLPSGIDCLLGMDWLKQYNPLVNWTTGEVTFEAGLHSEDGTKCFSPWDLRAQGRHRKICWVRKTPEGLVSEQHMALLVKQNARVFEVHITDTRMDRASTKHSPIQYVETAVEDAKHRIALAKAKSDGQVLQVKSLTKARLDEILKTHAEVELVPANAKVEEPKEDPRHDTGKPKLFLNQPETEYKAINAELIKAKDLHVLELTPEHVQSNNSNAFRKELLEHEIELDDDHKPPNRPYYRMSQLELSELKRQVQKYLDAGMIEPSKSPYGAACLFAPKKNGKLRFCIDYRPLNNITKKNAVQPPAVDDCLQQMTGCSIFSCIDLASGYHQVPIKESDKEKTAFNTKYGHYQWKVLPFGLCNAPATFVQALNRIFSGEAHREKLEKSKVDNPDIKMSAEDESLCENLLDKFICIYIDDILVFSENAEQHAEHLQQVFERLKRHGLLIQSPKAFYAQTDIEYLGHMISPDGISVQQEKVATVKEWPTPTEVSHIRQFLGLSGFYRKFIEKYAAKAKPLSDLTRKESSGPNGEFLWPPEAQNAFDTLKNALCSAPVLKIPDARQGEFHINCDASEFGLGATLFQKGREDGKMHPCAYISRALKPSEVRAYAKSRCVYELELQALMYSLEKWRHLLEGQVSTTVETDHRSLTWLQTQSELTKTQTAYLDTLARYDLNVKYLKGELNIPADAPSRRPDYKAQVEKYLTDTQLDEFEEMRQTVIKLKDELKQLRATTPDESTKMESGMAKAKQRRKAHVALSQISQRMNKLKRGTHVCEATVSPRNAQLNAWLTRIVEGYARDDEYKGRTDDSDTDTQFDLIENHGHMLWYHRTVGDDLPPALCVPNDAHCRELILKEFHAPPTIGHYNGEDMYVKMRRCYYWKDMKQDCLKYASTCTVCQPHKPMLSKQQGLLAEPEFPSRPWSSVALDFFGPMNRRGKIGPDSILVAVCRYTKMAHYIPCPSTAKADDIADLLVEHVIKLHGIADDYRSDRDKIFTSKFWDRVWSRLGTTLSLSTAYHHQTAGQVERVNQEMRRYLAIYCDSHADWRENLALAELAYNSHINSSTGCTPFELNYGFQPRNPNELITPTPLREITDMSRAEKEAAKKGDQWLVGLHDKWEKAETSLRKTYQRYERFYNRNHVDTRDLYPVGCKAYLRTRELANPTTVGRETATGQDEHVKRKLLPFFLGPFRVVEICGKNSLNRKLALSPSLLEKLGSDIFHIEKLKPAGERDEPFSVSGPIPPPTPTDEEFFVERIVAYEQRTQGKRYLVKWEGYPDAENTWEWEWMLENAQDKLREFMQTNPVVKNPVKKKTRITQPSISHRKKRVRLVNTARVVFGPNETRNIPSRQCPDYDSGYISGSAIPQ